jgi:2-polyprenyl-3-methyl-5-hydroxy-6-metoxy-1,4-benzoquinol methylase
MTRMTAPESGFRSAFYESYVSGHQGEIDERRSTASLEIDILARMPADRGVTILDIGCGQGQLVRLLRAAGYRNVRGIDVSAEQIALANKLGTDGLELADLFVFAESHQGVFDVLITIDVVEHFDRPDLLRLFQTLSGMLRDGGSLILRAPNAASPFAGRILYGDVTHGTSYTSRSLQQLGRATGFATVRSHPSRPAGRHPRQLIRRALWAAIERLLIVALVVETGQLNGHIVTQNLIGVLRRPG